MPALNAHQAEASALGRTALVCVLMLALAVALAHRLTHGFQVWTDEDARRLEVALQPRPAPTVQVEGPGLPLSDLPAVLGHHGGATVVDFIYTDCQTVCLSQGSVLQQIQAELQATAQADVPAPVRLLSISFDGQRDAPPALRAHGQRFDADPRWWQLVRVPDAAQEQQLLRQWGVVVVPDGRGDYEHNAALLVLDAQGRLRRIFDLEERTLALSYARHLGAQAAGRAPGAAS